MAVRRSGAEDSAEGWLGMHSFGLILKKRAGSCMSRKSAVAVVTKDIEPWTVVGGNPAKVIKRRELRG